MTDLQVLAASQTFRGLDSRLIDRLLETGQRKVLIDGDVLFRTGQEYTREIYIVMDGEIVIQRSDGQTYTVGLGDFVGLSSFLDYAPYTSTAYSQGKVELLVLSENAFQSIKQDFPELSTAVNRSIADRIRRWNPGRRGTTGVLVQPVRSVMTVPFAACSSDTTLLQALEIMRSRKIGSLGVVDPDGRLVGIATPAAIAEAVLIKDVPNESSLLEAGTEEAFTVSPDDQVWEAEQLQQDYGVKYLAVIEDGVPVGMVSQTDIVRSLSVHAQRNILISLAAEADSIDELKGLFGQIDECAEGALEYNRRATTALRVLSESHLAIHRRCVELTQRSMQDDGFGEPPVAYALLIMGSGGRKEMMLEPDQDNGIILEDSPQIEKEDVQQWFMTFSERLNANLDAIGYPLCPGDIMARNPLFHKSLAEWKKQISYIASQPTEKAARWSNVFFDFDTMYGDDSLTIELRKYIQNELQGKPRLLTMMVEDDAEGRPPIGMFNRLIPTGEGDEKGKIDVKRNGLRIIANAARIFALSRRVNACSTYDRINALVRLGVLDADFADSVLSAYEELITMVLDHQLDQHGRGLLPDKVIELEKLTPHQRETLRDSMLAVKRFQEKLQGEFSQMPF